MNKNNVKDRKGEEREMGEEREREGEYHWILRIVSTNHTELNSN